MRPKEICMVLKHQNVQGRRARVVNGNRCLQLIPRPSRTTTLSALVIVMMTKMSNRKNSLMTLRGCRKPLLKRCPVRSEERAIPQNQPPRRYDANSDVPCCILANFNSQKTILCVLSMSPFEAQQFAVAKALDSSHNFIYDSRSR